MEVGSRSFRLDNDRTMRRTMKKKMEKVPLAMILSFNDKDVNPNCPNASNPYHKCGRHCISIIPSGNNLLDAVRSDDGREWEKKSEKTGINFKCSYASNPYHKCDEDCLEKLPDKRKGAEKDQPGMKLKKELECAEYCLQDATKLDKANEDTPKKESHKGGGPKFKEGEIISIPEQRVNLEGKNSPIYRYSIAESCFENDPENILHEQVIRLKSTKGGDRVLNNVSDVKTESAPLQRWNTWCKNASNPYHVCTELCSQTSPKKHYTGQGNKLKEGKRVFASPQGSTSHCKHESNPYHVCADYCLENFVKISPPRQTTKKNKEQQEIAALPSGMNPECKLASNPYHVCAEYCSQNTLGLEQNGQDMKVKSVKELKNSFSHKKITNGHLLCKYASNPYHECDKYCFNQNLRTPERKKGGNCSLIKEKNPAVKCEEHYSEGISPKNIEADEVMIKEKRDILSMETKKNHSIADKDITKDLHTEIQPLHIDASDLFLEWAKYCSQENATEDDESVKQERKVANGKGLVNNYDDPARKTEKVGDVRTGCFLPMSLFILIGFLLSVLCRPQYIIHSLVVSLQRRAWDFRE